MEIPLSMLLLLCLVFTIIGAALMLLLQYYLYLRFSILPEASAEQKDINTKYSLPARIQQTARAINLSSPAAATTGHTHTAGATDAAPLMSINFVMQFLFHELKNSSRVRKWFYRKLSLELDELLAKTTTGKLFDKLTIKELELGDQFPEIRNLRVHNVELDEAGDRIENLDILLEIHYTGNFRTWIDADMVLGKKGSLTLIVKQLSGLARLQFTRDPYTHWSLSFLGDPELDLAIESKYQGRQMQSNITSLISNQIRKAVRRKHTLPNYKLRYKPFFHKTPEEDAGDGDIQPNGTLEVKVSEISRLMCPEVVTEVYCTLTLASLAFVEIRQKDNRNVVVSMDVEIHKAKNQQVGILFRQISEQGVEIEAVLPNTPACKSDLRAGDMLTAIEGKRVISIQQVAKIFKSLQASVFRLRIERIIPGIIRNDAILEDLELYEDLGDAHMGYGVGKTSTEAELSGKQTISRPGTAEKCTSSESSHGNTPTSSPKKTKLITKALKKTISRDSSDQVKEKEDDFKVRSKQLAKQEIKPKGSPKTLGDGVNEVEHYYQHSTVDCSIGSLIHMDDMGYFKLDESSRFLNIGVYSKCTGDSLLLGFVNIPVGQILAECCETSLVQCWKKFELSPPMPQDLKTHKLSSQSGFNADLCFGDMLLAFTWDGNPNLSLNEAAVKQVAKSKSKNNIAAEKTDNDSGIFDNNSLRSVPSSSSLASTTQTSSNQLRAHSFVRTHFQRATQCDFCGKKIWLKDAVQCSECAMCCHKKCITKCQNATVCGPVDCSTALQQRQPSISSTAPEFTVTDADALDASEGEEAMSGENEETVETASTKASPTPSLEVHRSSLTGLLAQGMKRVNSANNLAIPGIVSSLTGGGGGSGGGGTGGSNTSLAKSLPPSPQRSPSRKSSLVCNPFATFEVITQRLEAIPTKATTLSVEQINAISEPIMSITKDEDVMTLAKNASRNLYSNINGVERVEKINLLLSKLRLALDSETATYSSLASASTTKNDSVDTNNAVLKSTILSKSEERVQALSVIMLYLCTALQHAQGVEMR
ncbi:PDZ domain-containing protein 8 [Anastrepha ludens]|uniref:PDZ domain-containing protein 8 n=1 Tax=Anastrepha ludens TaxID=28586 RepID=UPI0023AFFDBF|nr:PDZ domain-containing protein 8 [Anastrepha ludens]